MPYANDSRIMVGINKDTQVNVAIIAAPGAGKRIAIDYLVLNPSGGNNIVTLTGKAAVPFGLNDNQALILENSPHLPEGIYPCSVNQAFSIALGSNTQVEGYALYRIIE